MSRISLCAAILFLAAPLWAQSKPAATPDPAPILEKLAIPASHDAALEQLKKLPASAIVPLFEAVNDDSRPKNIRDDIADAIDAIATRERAVAAKDDAAKDQAWGASTGLTYYKKLGSNPKWDAKVSQGLQRIGERNPAGLDDLKAALDAGCTDPWIRALLAYDSYSLGRIDAGAAAGKFADLLEDMESSRYPESRKIAVISDFLSLSRKGADANIPDDTRRRALDYAIAHFKDFAADHPGHTLLRQVAANLYSAAVPGHDRGTENGRKVVDAIAAALPDDSLSYFFKANFYTEWAWEARGGGFADTVTDQGWRTFHERLGDARTFADKGWRLNPLDPDCPTVMIQICMGDGAERTEMESWFSRAMLADPHNYMGCLAKEQFLLPKWGGSEKEALEFARSCVAHGNADDRLPTILVQTYKDILELSTDPRATTSTDEYWRDIQSVYQKLLADKSRLQAHRAQYLLDRANYLKAACDSEHWKEAAALIKEFGNDIDIKAIGGQTIYDYDKRKATEATAGKGTDE